MVATLLQVLDKRYEQLKNELHVIDNFTSELLHNVYTNLQTQLENSSPIYFLLDETEKEGQCTISGKIYNVKDLKYVIINLQPFMSQVKVTYHKDNLTYSSKQYQRELQDSVGLGLHLNALGFCDFIDGTQFTYRPLKLRTEDCYCQSLYCIINDGDLQCAYHLSNFNESISESVGTNSFLKYNSRDKLKLTLMTMPSSPYGKLMSHLLGREMRQTSPNVWS